MIDRGERGEVSPTSVGPPGSQSGAGDTTTGAQLVGGIFAALYSREPGAYTGRRPGARDQRQIIVCGPQ